MYLAIIIDLTPPNSEGGGGSQVDPGSNGSHVGYPTFAATSFVAGGAPVLLEGSMPTPTFPVDFRRASSPLISWNLATRFCECWMEPDPLFCREHFLATSSSSMPSRLATHFEQV